MNPAMYGVWKHRQKIGRKPNLGNTGQRKVRTEVSLCVPMARKRENANWASGIFMHVRSTMPTEFEKRMHELRLTNDTCAGSDELRRWCEDKRPSLHSANVVIEFVKAMPKHFRAHSQGIADSDKLGNGKCVSQTTL